MASEQFAKAFGNRFTKQSMVKVVPAAGIIVGGTFNWAIFEGVVDAADIAYRQRFLLEKYPHLRDEDASLPFPGADADADTHADDEAIGVLSEVLEAGGPDIC
nr:EcsC family protein [Nesterenkonia sp. Act20]